MIINFQYNRLFVLPADGAVSEGAVLMDDSEWSLCFKRLTEEGRDVAVRCSDARRLVAHLRANYIGVKAAGGIVEDGAGRRLLMVRNGRSDLPKGKVEAGETLACAALRETNEETGLCDLMLGPLLLKTYHIYDLYGGWHFKQTAWYAMRALETSHLVPQTDEGITSLCWLPYGQWRDSLATSYATMQIINTQVPDEPLVRADG